MKQTQPTCSVCLESGKGVQFNIFSPHGFGTFCVDCEKLDRTPNGIAYAWGVSSSDGAWFTLYPTESQKAEEVKVAKRWLRETQDVVSISTVRNTHKEPTQ